MSKLLDFFSKRKKAAATGAVVLGLLGTSVGGGITILAPQPEASPADFFVATTGSDSNPGTQESPFLTFDKCADQSVTAEITCEVAAGTYVSQRVDVRTRTAVATFRPASGAAVTLGCRTPLATTVTFSGSSNTVDVADTSCFLTIASPCSPVAAPCTKIKVADATLACPNNTKTATGWTGCNLEACSSNVPCKFYAGAGVYDNGNVGLLVAGASNLEFRDMTAEIINVFTETVEPANVTFRDMDSRAAEIFEGNGVSIIGGNYGNERGSGRGKAIQIGNGPAEAGPTSVTIDGAVVEHIDTSLCGRTGASGCHIQGIKVYPVTALTVKNITIVDVGTFAVFIEAAAGFTSGLTWENNFIDLPTGVCGGNTLGDGNPWCRGAATVVFKYKDTGATFADQTFRHNSFAHNGGFLMEAGNTYTASVFTGSIVEKPTFPAGWTTNYNVFEGAGCTGTNVCVTDTATTEFTSDATANFHLLGGSVALALVASGCPSTDYDGDARPASNCDAGADEVG
jgi:hypothetical protein